MIKVVDKNGEIVDGLYRNADGSLIVKNDQQYHQHQKVKDILEKQQKAVVDISNELQELKRMMSILILSKDRA